MRCLSLAALVCLSRLTAAQPAACPDSLDPASFVDVMVDKAYGQWRTQATVPPTCLFERVARAPWLHTDSVILQSVELTGAIAKHTPNDARNLAARILLLARAGRYASVEPALNDLAAISPGLITLPMQRAVVAAAYRLHDTAMIRRQLSIGSARFPSHRPFAAESEIMEQLGRLRALPDSVHRRLRDDPSLVDGYAALVSIYGNLNQPDSSLAYVRIALRKGVARLAVATSLESLVGTTIRHAQLLDAPDAWEATLPLATRIDSALSTPASKYLVALALSQVLADQTRIATEILTGGNVTAPSGLTRKRLTAGQESYIKVMNCPRLAESFGQLAQSREMLLKGGERFDPRGAATIRSALLEMERVLSMLKPYC